MNIYKFTHIETGRVYVGQTIQDANQRRFGHLAAARGTKRTNKLYNAIRKYGVDSFVFEVIATADTIEELNQLEVKYIKEYDSIANGFNLREGGDNKTHSPESIEKMRKVHLARHANNDIGGWTRRDGGNMKGKTHSAETKEQMSASAKGRKHTEEARAKMSKTRKGKWYGTEETRRKLSIAGTGRWHTEEAKAKMSVLAKKREAKKREARRLVNEN